MFTPEELESIPIAIEKLFSDLQLRVMTDIVRRLTNVQDVSASADYQMSRLYELGKSKKEIQRLVQETLNKSDEEIDSIFTDIIQGGYARDKQLYTAVGKNFIPYKENKPLQQLVKAMRMQTKDDCYNITQSMGFAVKQHDGKLAFKPIAQYYQDTLDKAVVDITSGTFDYNTVLNRTVTEMTNSGLRTVDYASGWSNRVNVAARRAVMTGVRQVTAKISEDNAEKLETEYFEVSWHRGARPSHQEFQGKVYSKDELVSVCGLGTVTGLGGANCYHSYDSFIPGVSERKYTDEWLAEQNDKENTPVEYNGKEYTVYEATQRQRSLETTMRAQREKIKLLEDGNADEDSIITAKARYFKTSDEYVRFSKAMDLPQQRERVFIDGNGRIFDKSVAKSAESGIIKEQSKKSITKITDSAISNVSKLKIEGYTEAQCDEIQKQHKELLRYSRDKNDNKEVAFVFRKDMSERIEFLGQDDKLNFGSGLLGKGNDLMVMHNHPRNSSYSATDLVFFRDYSNVKTLTIVKNNGNVEYITKGKDFDGKKFKLEYDRLYRKIVINNSDSEKDKFVKALLNKTKSGVIWSERK